MFEDSINPIRLEWVLFSLYLRHGFCSESEDVEANRVKKELQCVQQRRRKSYYTQKIAIRGLYKSS